MKQYISNTFEALRIIGGAMFGVKTTTDINLSVANAHAAAESHMMKKYDFQWYVTLHPKMDREIHKLYNSIDLHNVKFVESTELIECFKNSDLMLCDTSSIIYEFLTQLKPVVTFQTEKVEECLINITEINKLEDAILHVINDLSLNSKHIAKSVDRFHPYTDGQSSNRILDNVELMLSGKNLPLKKKPMNIIRNFKMRRELGYWRF